MRDSYFSFASGQDCAITSDKKRSLPSLICPCGKHPDRWDFRQRHCFPSLHLLFLLQEDTWGGSGRRKCFSLWWSGRDKERNNSETKLSPAGKQRSVLRKGNVKRNCSTSAENNEKHLQCSSLRRLIKWERLVLIGTYRLSAKFTVLSLTWLICLLFWGNIFLLCYTD